MFPKRDKHAKEEKVPRVRVISVLPAPALLSLSAIDSPWAQNSDLLPSSWLGYCKNHARPARSGDLGYVNSRLGKAVRWGAGRAKFKGVGRP